MLDHRAKRNYGEDGIKVADQLILKLENWPEFSRVPNRVVRGSALKPPTLARHHSDYLHELFYDRRSWTELISHHQPEEFGKGLKETLCVRPLPGIPLASIHLGWAMREPPGKTELEWLATDHPETNPITIKPETASRAAEQYWVPLPYCSPPGSPFPIKSLALSAHVSPRTILYRVLDKSPASGPGRGPPSCNRINRTFISKRRRQKRN